MRAGEGAPPPPQQPPVVVNCSASYPIGPTANGSMSEQCAWAALLVKGVGWVNATVQVDVQGRDVVLGAHVARSGGNERAPTQRIMASAYGWGPIPMMSVYDTASGLPLLAWNETV